MSAALETECVWELGDHRSIYINEDKKRAGHAAVTILVDDLDTTLGEIAPRGIEPAKRETYSNGVRKATFRDADDNLDPVAVRVADPLGKPNFVFAQNNR